MSIIVSEWFIKQSQDRSINAEHIDKDSSHSGAAGVDVNCGTTTAVIS